MAHGDDELQTRLEALFLEELQDDVRILADGLAALEDTDDEEAGIQLVQRLFRAAHGLKGAAHSAGVNRAVGPCHRLEELLAAFRSGHRPLDDTAVAALQEHLDALIVLERDLSTPAPDDHAVDAPAETVPASAQVPPRSTLSDGRARVDVARLDRLVHRTGALMSSVQHVRLLADGIATVGETAAVLERRRRHSAVPAGRLEGERSPVPDTLGRLATEADDIDRQLRHLSTEVADTAQDLRLQPFRDVAAGLDRSVRELCRSTGTEARLVIDGGDVELDRDIGDAIREPLLHLVRNAVDHGIEDPGSRSASGKSPTGTVRVSAVIHGTHVVVTVSDDGAGLDVDALRAAAGRSEPGSTPEDEDLELAFLPGLSTATAITAVSGRGVGLDAARATIESLGGTIHLRTESGQGTEVVVHVARTLAVLRVLMVDVGQGQWVALPMASVVRLHRLAIDEIEHLEGRLAVAINGRSRPAVQLSAAVGLITGPMDDTMSAVAIEIADEEGVLLVERADADLDVVLQPLPARIAGSAGILGAALVPDGRVGLVVNPSVALRTGLSATTLSPPPATPPPPRRRVLLAEDTLTTRALERSILEGAGYEVVVAADGAEALALLRDQQVDVVVSDVDMPNVSGIELCEAIRSSVRLADLPVILVSSLASEGDRQRGLEAGANAYLAKSAFEQAALLDLVRQFV